MTTAASPRQEGWRRIWPILGGVAATILFAALALRGVDVQHVLSTWSSIQAWPWVPLAIGSYLAGQVVRGIRCRLLFGPQAQLGNATATNIVVVGYACNNILPLRLGELVRAGMLTERTGAPYVKSFAVIVVERVLDGIAILSLLLLAVFLLPVEGWIHQLARTGAAVFGIALVLLIPAIAFPGLVVNVATRLGAVHPSLQSLSVRLAMRVTNALQVLRDPVVVVEAAALSLLIWVLEGGLFAFMLPAFHLELPAAAGLLAMGVTNLGIMVPSTPGYVGPFHYFCQQALATQGVPRDLGLGYATAVHLAFYIPVTLWGAAGLLWYGVELGAALSMTRRARSAAQPMTFSGVLVYPLEDLPPRAVTRTPETRLLHAIVEALVAPGERYGRRPTRMPSGDHVALDNAVADYRKGDPDPALVTAATEFLQAEIEALPVLLSTAVAIGLTGFRAIVFVTNLRPFCALPLQRRKAIVESWAYGRLGLARTFFRPLRSIACLAYYETLARRVPLQGARREAAHG
jgi:uncharacterized protein (TIRG00374 family)